MNKVMEIEKTHILSEQHLPCEVTYWNQCSASQTAHKLVH